MKLSIDDEDGKFVIKKRNRVFEKCQVFDCENMALWVVPFGK